MEERAFQDLVNLANASLDRQLKVGEVNKLTKSITRHLVPIAENETKIFILGSYAEDDKWRLKMAQDSFQELYRTKGSSEAYTYLMDEIPGDGPDLWINATIKWDFLAHVADHIVGVLEHDGGDFLMEQGMLSQRKEFRDKLILLKREYDTQEEERNHYSFMQSNGVFQQFAEKDRIFKWSDNQSFLTATEDAYELMQRNEEDN